MDITKRKIEYVPIDSIHPFPGNPRRMSDEGMAKLRRSLREFNWTVPCLVQASTRFVIAGNMRRQAAKLEGFTEAAVIVLDVDDITAKAMNLADNRLSEEATWDTAGLLAWAEDLTANGYDLALTGFSADDLDGLLAGLPGLDAAAAPGEVFDPPVPTPPAKPITRPGDAWHLGRHRLMCGDSTQPGDVAALMAGAVCDCMVTDPPYGVDYAAKNADLNRQDGGQRLEQAMENDNNVEYRPFYAAFLRVAPLADYNTVYVCMSNQELHSLRLALDDTGFKWGDYLVWVKNNHVLGRKDYNAKHELVVYGWKGRHHFYGGFSTTVLEYDRPQKNDLHPTMKPVPLFARLMSDGCPAGGRVYDPFAGSGTTLIAAEQTGHTCWCMEVSPAYCDVIVQRWEAFTGQKASRNK